MNVFKFGGASVNSAEAVRNMVNIVKAQGGDSLLVVVSAMGKTTNLLEKLVPGVTTDVTEREQLLHTLRQYHLGIAFGLFSRGDHPVFDKLCSYFDLVKAQSERKPTSYNYDYDQTVSFGELISTTIIAEYMNEVGVAAVWVDARECIRTDSHYRESNVDWAFTRRNTATVLAPLSTHCVVITQGFIAGTANGTTTTLGREGSDYSAAIFAHCLRAKSVTIWKDVPGFLNADPKFFKNTIKIHRLPYSEAIEQAYYGASIIHPKTIKPLQNEKIELHIKSFLAPSQQGSVIGEFNSIEPQVPLYIFRDNQVLISIQPQDFSFVAEANLQHLFATLSSLGIRVNLMQNSAISFSLCVDNNPLLLEELRQALSSNYRLRYNEHLQLITVRYYTSAIIDDIVANRPVLLQQYSRNTAQIIVDNRSHNEIQA